MSTGAFIGIIIGLLAGIGFMALSIFSGASQLEPPPIIAIMFMFIGGGIGHAISEARKEVKKKKMQRKEE